MVLICIYVGAIYGGSRSAILLNIPGTPASAASTLDGYPLARQGLAGRAMGISTSGSWLGTLFGILCLALLTPVLSELCPVVPELRVLLDRGVRRRDCRHAGRRRSAQGLSRRLPRACGSPPSARSPTTTISATRSASRTLPAASACCRRWSAPTASPRCCRPCAAPPSRPSQQARFDRAAHRGRAQVLAHHLPLRRHRRLDRHSARPRRGRRGVVLLCRRAPRQQGEGEVRQGLDRGPDGGRDRRGLLRARCHHSGADAGAARLGAGGGADGGDDDPRPQSRAEPDGGVAAVLLPDHRHAGDRRHEQADLRLRAGAAADQDPAGAARAA